MSLMSSLSNRIGSSLAMGLAPQRPIKKTGADHSKSLTSAAPPAPLLFVGSTMADDFILPPPSGGSRVGDLRARLSSLVAAATPLAAAPSPAAAAAASAAAPNVDEEGEFSLSASAVDLSVVSPGGAERANAARFRGITICPSGSSGSAWSWIDGGGYQPSEPPCPAPSSHPSATPVRANLSSLASDTAATGPSYGFSTMGTFGR